MSLGRDEAETIRALKEIIASLGAPRTVTIGASMGGFAAFRYGALLDAYAAMSFAGPTELRFVYDTAKNSVWNPGYFVKLQLQRESEMPVDLVPLLHRGGKTKFFQFFGEDAAADAHQARRHKGIDKLTLMPVRRRQGPSLRRPRDRRRIVRLNASAVAGMKAAPDRAPLASGQVDAGRAVQAIDHPQL
ncbi:MAG: hypothetical protein FJX45_10330 [Alphaproteobacteria bacterium]|nr:hypothetical protein [Alphaproteobacteria bacterium]MBM3653778.1 hypothetical protein [Alphaproteobacteria bacterium]